MLYYTSVATVKQISITNRCEHFYGFCYIIPSGGCFNELFSDHLLSTTISLSLCHQAPVWFHHLHVCILSRRPEMFCFSNVFSRLCDNPLLESGARTLLEALPENQSLTHLSLMHTGLGDQGALELAQRLPQHTLQELNVAYNNIGDNAALALVDACREHPSIHTVQ